MRAGQRLRVWRGDGHGWSYRWLENRRHYGGRQGRLQAPPTSFPGETAIPARRRLIENALNKQQRHAAFVAAGRADVQRSDILAMEEAARAVDQPGALHRMGVRRRT
jgi:hypothetical protein